MNLRDIRRNGAAALSGNWFIAILASVVVFVLSLLFTVVANLLTNGGFVLTNPLLCLTLFLLLSVAELIVMNAVSVGYAEFFLDIADTAKPRLVTLFAHFNKAGRAIAVTFLVVLRVFIGMIFFVIPGIIAAYKYSMVYYVMATNPDLTASEVLRESKYIMRGNKWRLFCLDFSLIGWYFLIGLTFGLASFFVAPYIQSVHANFFREVECPLVQKRRR